jgi:hypothetical protein
VSRAGIKLMGAKKVRVSSPGKTLPLIQLPERLIRISKKSYADPIHWSKLGVHRFNSPVAIYSVLYASNSVETAILEVFGDHGLSSTKSIRLTWSCLISANS